MEGRSSPASQFKAGFLCLMVMASLTFLLNLCCSFAVILIEDQSMVWPVAVMCSWTAELIKLLCSSVLLLKGLPVSPM